MSEMAMTNGLGMDWYARQLQRREDQANGLPGSDLFMIQYKEIRDGGRAVGRKDDVGKPRCALVLLGFSRALIEVSKVGTLGAQKYADDGWQHVKNGRERYTDAMLRHLLAEHTGKADEDGLSHAAHVAWNALARLELLLMDGEK